MTLLNTFGLATETFLLIIAISVVLYFIIIYYLFRFIFSIKRQLWNQKQQINILIKIAHKLGVNEHDEELIEIKSKNEASSDDHL